MKTRRLSFAFLTLFSLLILLLFIILLFQSSISAKIKSKKLDALVLTGISQKLEELDKDISNSNDKWLEKNESAAKMMAAALKNLVTKDGYRGKTVFDDGFVVRKVNDEIVYPKDFTGAIDGLENAFIDDTIQISEGIYHNAAENTDGRHVIIFAEPMTEGFYYVHWALYNDYYRDALDFSNQADSILTDMEKSYEKFFLVVSSKDNTLLYCSNLLCFSEDEPTLEDLELSRDIINNEPETLLIDNEIYVASYRQIRFLDENAKVIILNSINDQNTDNKDLIIMTLLLEGLIITGLILWQYWVQHYVQSHNLSENQANRYQPYEIRKKTAAVGIVGALAIFIISMFYQSLSNLKQESVSDNTSLWIAADYIANIHHNKSLAQEDQEKWSAYYAEKTAELMTENPELRTKPVLASINDIIGSEYIMLYDEDGNEIISSNSYEGFQLGTKAEDPTTDFRRLLLGVDTIIHPPTKMQTTGKNAQLTGSRMRLSEENKKYGAVILAYNSLQSWEAENEKNIQEFINRITQESHLCVVADAEKQSILYTNKKDLLNTGLASAGLFTNDRFFSDMDHFTVNGNSYYGPFEQIEEYIYYYLTEEDLIQSNSFEIALISALGFLVIVVLVSLIMLYSYRTKKYKETTVISETAHLDSVLDMDISTKDDNIIDFESTGFKFWWAKLIPEMKVRIFLQFFTGLLLILVSIQIFYSSNSSSQTVFEFIFRGNWTRGFNLLAISSILLLILGFVIFLFFKGLLVAVLKNILDPKGETILRLISSLVQYGSFIGLLFISLNYLGINTAVMVAGFSAFSLAITLGGQGLVADILAGIFIIFEDDFHVGDLIDVNGFQGIVQDIGVRSTKILGLGDNVKIIGNHDIKNVLNLSKMNTWYNMDFNVPVNQPLKEIEEMLKTELPEIGSNIPEIISGPFYKGVWTIGTNAYTLSVNAECKEINLRKVRRKLNHAMIDLFEKYGFKIG